MSIGHPRAAPRYSYGLDPAVHAERAKHVADVIADRLGGQMQLVGDLPGRASVFEQSEHLGLPRCEVRVWRCLAVPRRSPTSWPKTPTMRSPFLSGTAADLERHPGPVGPQENPFGLRDRDCADDLAREELTRATGLLRRDDRGEVPSPHIPDELHRRRIDPADHPCLVEDVARHGDVLEGSTEIRHRVPRTQTSALRVETQRAIASTSSLTLGSKSTRGGSDVDSFGSFGVRGLVGGVSGLLPVSVLIRQTRKDLMRTTGFMKTRLLAVALGAVCISLLFGFHSNATAAGSGDPRITILQGQVRALQAQVKLLQTRDKTFSKELASTEGQVELSFSSQTCLAAHVADLFEGTWGVIDQIKPTFGPRRS